MNEDFQNEGQDSDLVKLRQAICHLDSEILRLLKERIEVAKLIGREKTQHQIPVKDRDIEDLVRERNRATAIALGLHRELADDLSELLIRYAIRAQTEITSAISVSSENQGARDHEDSTAD